MKTSSTILMLAAAAGILLMASCNKMENDQPQDVTVEQSEGNVQQLDEATKCLGEAYSKMDLSELGPLADKLKDGPLKNLIAAIGKGFNPENIHLGPSSFAKIYQYLLQLWALNECSFPVILGEDTYFINCNTELIEGVVNHSLLIQKNEEQLLKMVSSHSFGAYSGALTIKGMNLILDHNHTGIGTQTVSLTLQPVDKEEALLVLTSDITDAFTWEDIQNKNFGRSSNYSASVMGGTIIINGHVKHVGQLFAQSASLAFISKEGTDEKTCQEVAASFNENVTIFLDVNDANVGVIYADPLYSLEMEKYTIAFMVDSPMLGDEPLDITSALAAFGFDIEDMFGPKDE